MLAQIKGNTTSEPKAEPSTIPLGGVKLQVRKTGHTELSPEPVHAAPAEPDPRRKPSQSGGKPAAFWLDDTDRAILREFGVMMYAEGIKPSDSLVARAGLRLLPRDHRFMDTVRQLVEQDKRRVRHQKPAEKEA